MNSNASRTFLLTLATLVVAGAHGPATAAQPADPPARFNLTSPDFSAGGEIPAKFTCDGADSSPALKWTAPPEGTKSFALIVDDPDAPVGTWVHWVIYDLPPETRKLDAGAPKDAEFPSGARQGITDFRRLGYGGPCPPRGPAHRYFFKLYALDAKLDLKSGATKAEVEQAMNGHVLAQAELVGRYVRAR